MSYVLRTWVRKQYVNRAWGYVNLPERWSVGGSVGRSVGGSVGQSVGRSVGRWVSRSVGGSVGGYVVGCVNLPERRSVVT